MGKKLTLIFSGGLASPLLQSIQDSLDESDFKPVIPKGDEKSFDLDAFEGGCGCSIQ